MVQPGIQKWNAVTKLGETDMVVNECVAYCKAQQPLPVDKDRDPTYEEI